jgi:hypothetical protein
VAGSRQLDMPLHVFHFGDSCENSSGFLVVFSLVIFYRCTSVKLFGFLSVLIQHSAFIECSVYKLCSESISVTE